MEATSCKSFEKFLVTFDSIAFDIFDEDITKLENKKNIFDCLNDESISEFKMWCHISSWNTTKKVFSASCIGESSIIFLI